MLSSRVCLVLDGKLLAATSSVKTIHFSWPGCGAPSSLRRYTVPHGSTSEESGREKPTQCSENQGQQHQDPHGFDEARLGDKRTHKSPYSRSMDEQLLRLRAESKTWREISDLMGVSPAKLTERYHSTMSVPKPIGKGKPLQPQEILDIVRLREERSPLIQIARKLQRSRSAVQNVLRAHGLRLKDPAPPQRPWSLAEIEEYHRLTEAQLPYTEIATRLGRSVTAIRQRKWRH